MSACAWDSVPEDLGFQLVREKMVKEGVVGASIVGGCLFIYNQIPYSVEGFVDVIPGPHGYRANFGT